MLVRVPTIASLRSAALEVSRMLKRSAMCVEYRHALRYLGPTAVLYCLGFSSRVAYEHWSIPAIYRNISMSLTHGISGKSRNLMASVGVHAQMNVRDTVVQPCESGNTLHHAYMETMHHGRGLEVECSLLWKN
jgi:hypothetical protein